MPGWSSQSCYFRAPRAKRANDILSYLPSSHLSSNLPITASSSSFVGTPPVPPPAAGSVAVAPSPPLAGLSPPNLILFFPSRNGKTAPKNDPRNSDDAAAEDSDWGKVSESQFWRHASLPGVGQVANTTVFLPQENLGGGGQTKGQNMLPVYWAVATSISNERSMLSESRFKLEP